MGAAPVGLALVVLLLVLRGRRQQALAHGCRRREVEPFDVDGRQRAEMLGDSRPFDCPLDTAGFQAPEKS
jgi:hypothetical protein